MMDGVGFYMDLSSALPEFSSFTAYSDPEVYSLPEAVTILSASEPLLDIRVLKCFDAVFYPYEECRFDCIDNN